MKTVQIVIHCLPREIDQLERLCNSLRESYYFVENQIDIILDVTLNLNDKIAINKVVKFEQLNTELKQVYDHLGLDFEEFKKIGKARETVKKNHDYTQEYNDDTKKIIENFYKKDLELFKYDF